MHKSCVSDGSCEPTTWHFNHTGVFFSHTHLDTWAHHQFSKMDHAVKTSKTKPWDKLRFENEELECLYQRYTLKMQRFSVIGVVSLFVIFCMTMMTLSYVFSSLLTLHVRIEVLDSTVNELNRAFVTISQQMGR